MIAILLLPLLAAIAVCFGTPDGQYRRARWAVWLLGAAFAGSVACLFKVATGDALAVRLYQPADIARAILPIGFEVDRLAAVMMVLVSGVGTLIFQYSIRFMYQEPGYGRFLALIGFTTSVLLAMVASANLVMLFVCWQLLSYLLYQLAHNMGHGPTREGAVRTFRLLRFGDALFLAGILLARFLYGTTELRDLFARAAHDTSVFALLPGVHITGLTLVALLVLLGAMAKSAQFPLHVWLPRSLYAPTPVTALLHAGIINACGFLVNRLAPLYGNCPATLHVAFVVGAATAIFGAATMLIQNDIKRTLGFSTIGQMGYMVMECGLGAFSLAVFHLIAHGLFKAYMFLGCGNVIHKARQERALPPAEYAPEEVELPPLTWVTGFATTMLMPLAILLIAHGVLRGHLVGSQGAVIFLFFSWVTSSQSILTLVRLRAVASWKVSITMVVTLLAVVFTYLIAAMRFDAFLYPDAAASATYFRAAALPRPFFDALVAITTAMFVASWVYLYAATRGRTLRLPAWVQSARSAWYVLLLNQLYLDRLTGLLSRGVRVRQARQEPRRASVGVSLAVHAALGVLPFALLGLGSGLQGGLPGPLPLVAGAIAAAWFVASWVVFDLTHEVMYGR